jgi:hypothetical protein
VFAHRTGDSYFNGVTSTALTEPPLRIVDGRASDVVRHIYEELLLLIETGTTILIWCYTQVMKSGIMGPNLLNCDGMP